ncbi:hypothetical protein Cadr_000031214, partial [Camelus dromedarius]
LGDTGPSGTHADDAFLKASLNSTQSGLCCVSFEIPPQDMRCLQPSSPAQERMAAPPSTRVPHVL